MKTIPVIGHRVIPDIGHRAGGSGDRCGSSGLVAFVVGRLAVRPRYIALLAPYSFAATYAFRAGPLESNGLQASMRKSLAVANG